MSIVPWIVGVVSLVALSLSAHGRDPTMDVKAGAVDSIFKLNATSKSGTGFVVKAKSGKKVMITNGHVCEIADLGVLFMAQVVNDTKGPIVPVVVVENWKEHDLCVLTAPPGAPALELGDSPKMDDQIFLVGYPGANFMTATSGYYLGVEYDTIFDGRDIDKCKDAKKLRIMTYEVDKGNGKIETKKICVIQGMWWLGTAQSDPGGSGSPVLDLDGKIVGVLSFVRGNSSWAGGVPLDELKRLLSKY